MRMRTFWLAVLVLAAVAPALFLVAVRKSLGDFAGLRPGDPMPAARLQPVGRHTLETWAWRDSPKFLVVFQPGCKACRLEIDSLAKIAPSFPEVKIVLLSTQRDFSGKNGPFPVYIDPEGSFLRKVRRVGTPAVYWIDTSGVVRYARIGQRSAREEETLFARQLVHDGW